MLLAKKKHEGIDICVYTTYKYLHFSATAFRTCGATDLVTSHACFEAPLTAFQSPDQKLLFSSSVKLS